MSCTSTCILFPTAELAQMLYLCIVHHCPEKQLDSWYVWMVMIKQIYKQCICIYIYIYTHIHIHLVWPTFLLSCLSERRNSVLRLHLRVIYSVNILNTSECMLVHKNKQNKTKHLSYYGFRDLNCSFLKYFHK